MAVKSKRQKVLQGVGAVLGLIAYLGVMQYAPLFVVGVTLSLVCATMLVALFMLGYSL